MPNDPSENAPAAKRFLAMLALDQPVSISSDDLVAEIERLYPRLPYKVTASKGAEAGSVVIMLDRSMLMVMIMDLPMPPGTLDQAVTGNLLWPQAASIVGRHRAHAIVSTIKGFSDHAGALSDALAVTLLLSALAELTPCLGLYWCSAETMTPPELVRQAGPKLLKGELPIDIWVRVYFAQESGGERLQAHAGANPRGELVSALTRGLIPFVGRELEMLEVPLPLLTVGERVIGLAQYLIQQGPVLRDGETAGVTATEKFRLRHVISRRAPGIPVIQLTLEQLDTAQTAPTVSPARPNGASAVAGPYGTPATRSFGRRTAPIKGN